MRGLLDRVLGIRIPSLALVGLWLLCAYRVATSGWIGDAHAAALGYVRREA